MIPATLASTLDSAIRGIDERRGCLLVRDVALNGRDVEGAEFFSELVESCLDQVGGDDPGPFLRQALRGRPPDAESGTGHDGPFSGEPLRDVLHRIIMPHHALSLTS